MTLTMARRIRAIVGTVMTPQESRPTFGWERGRILFRSPGRDGERRWRGEVGRGGRCSVLSMTSRHRPGRSG